MITSSRIRRIRKISRSVLETNSIPIFWLYILIVCIKASSSFSFQADILISSIYIRWSFFSGDFVNLYPPVHLLRIEFNSIIVITNSKGDCEAPWKILFGFKSLPEFVLLRLILLLSFPWLSWKQVSLKTNNNNNNNNNMTHRYNNWKTT